nr:hypothetical protein [Shewanella sp. VB17]
MAPAAPAVIHENKSNGGDFNEKATATPIEGPSIFFVKDHKVSENRESLNFIPMVFKLEPMNKDENNPVQKSSRFYDEKKP